MNRHKRLSVKPSCCLCFFVVVILQRSHAATDLNLVIRCFWQNASVLLSTELSDCLRVRWKEGEKKEKSLRTAFGWLQNVIKARRWLNTSIFFSGFNLFCQTEAKNKRRQVDPPLVKVKLNSGLYTLSDKGDMHFFFFLNCNRA